MGKRRMKKARQKSFWLTEEQDARARRAAAYMGDSDAAGNPKWSDILRAQLDEYVLSAFESYAKSSGNIFKRLQEPKSKQWLEDALSAGKIGRLRDITGLDYDELNRLFKHHGIKVTT
jgi:hypothetical protein